MKKFIIVLLITHCIPLIATAQAEPIKKDTNSATYRAYLKWQERCAEEKQDDDEMFKAWKYPIKKVIKDTLNVDSLVQWYYHSGGLYQQVTYKNGKENGVKETYHPNGQFCKKEMFVNGFIEWDYFTVYYNQNWYFYVNGFRVYGHSYITYDRYGKPDYISYIGKYKRDSIKIDKQYCYGEPCSLMIYNESKKGKLIKEYNWIEKTQTWQQRWYHIPIKMKKIKTKTKK